MSRHGATLPAPVECRLRCIDLAIWQCFAAHRVGMSFQYRLPKSAKGWTLLVTLPGLGRCPPCRCLLDRGVASAFAMLLQQNSEAGSDAGSYHKSLFSALSARVIPQGQVLAGAHRVANPLRNLP